MATRELSNLEVVQVLGDHTDIATLVQQHENLFGYRGSQKWNQILLAQSTSIPVPPRGLTFDDAYYGHVIVFPDASGVLHFVVTDNDSLAKEIAKPVYESDPDYWQLFQDIAKQYEHALAPILPTIGLSSIALLGVVAIVAVLVFRK
jgi:hypothetical protein